MISCHSPQRAAYGWQRDGGHAPFLLADESVLVQMPDAMTYVDGAMVACGKTAEPVDTDVVAPPAFPWTSAYDQYANCTLVKSYIPEHTGDIASTENP